MKCPVCGRTVDPSDAFCKHCGRPLTVKKNTSHVYGNLDYFKPQYRYIEGPKHISFPSNDEVSSNRGSHPSPKVVINVNGKRHNNHSADVISAIKYAYKVGAIYKSVTSTELIQLTILLRKTHDEGIAEAIFSIAHSYKSGAIAHSEEATDLIEGAIKRG